MGEKCDFLDRSARLKDDLKDLQTLEKFLEEGTSVKDALSLLDLKRKIKERIAKETKEDTEEEDYALLSAEELKRRIEHLEGILQAKKGAAQKKKPPKG